MVILNAIMSDLNQVNAVLDETVAARDAYVLLDSIRFNRLTHSYTYCRLQQDLNKRVEKEHTPLKSEIDAMRLALGIPRLPSWQEHEERRMAVYVCIL